jgi:peptide/nickel transport system substrate-binding protein
VRKYQWNLLSMIALLVTISLLVSACEGVAPPPSTSEAQSETQAEEPAAAVEEAAAEEEAMEDEEPAEEVAEASGKGGDLVIAFPISSEPASLDGHIDPYQPAWLFDSFVTDPLVILDPNGEYQPALATSWESSPDGSSWTFFLRDDVMFQDGTPFNAEAVKVNIERILAPETASAQMAADLGPVSSVEVVDEYTVKINYDEPWVTVLDVARRMPIWSPASMEQYSLAEYDKHLVGTGPFLLDEWVANDRLVFKKWEDYGGWNSIQKHEGPAHLDSVTIRFIGEEAVLGSMLGTGDADVIRELPSAYIGDYKDQPGFDFVTGYQAGTGLQMVINTRIPPLDQAKFRQALLYGTDQSAANDLLYDGTYLVSSGPLNVVHPCFWEGAEDLYPYDVDQATALLEEVGYRDEDGDGIREAYGVPGVEDGTPLTLRWTVLHHAEIGEAVQSQWRQLGIDLKLEQVAGPIQLERVNARDFDLIYERLRTPDPSVLDTVWNSRWDEPGGWAWTSFVDEELDETVGQLRTVPDFSERCELAAKAQQIILDNAVMLPTLSQPLFYGLSDKVQDFELASEGNYFFIHNTYIEE